MTLEGQPVLGRTEPFNFEFHKTLGWQCHCGAAENIPALIGDLTTMAHPILCRIQWLGCVRVLLLQCKLCGCEGRMDTLHQVVDGVVLVEGDESEPVAVQKQ